MICLWQCHWWWKAIISCKFWKTLKNEDFVVRRKKLDKEMESELTVCIYDLQAVMPLPRGDVSAFFIIRANWMFIILPSTICRPIIMNVTLVIKQMAIEE